jgi:hypothetical protein
MSLRDIDLNSLRNCLRTADICEYSATCSDPSSIALDAASPEVIMKSRLYSQAIIHLPKELYYVHSGFRAAKQ